MRNCWRGETRHGQADGSKCQTESRVGLHGDGDGLCLRVYKGGSKSWVQRLVIQRQRTDIGLGGFPLISLAEARDTAFENRRTARRGGNPRSNAATNPTFREAADLTLAARRVRWRNGKTEKIWTGQLARHAYPAIGNKRVDLITREDVLRILKPIWTKTPESGRRVRSLDVDLAPMPAVKEQLPRPTLHRSDGSAPQGGRHQREHGRETLSPVPGADGGTIR